MKKGLRAVWLPTLIAAGFSCHQASDGASTVSQFQLYQTVLRAALQESEVNGAIPQIQIQTVRSTPEGVAFPGDQPEHYTPGTNLGLVQAAEALSDVVVRRTPAQFDVSRPAEIFVVSDPTFSGDTLATVSLRAFRLPRGDAWWGDGWRATLRWEDGSWHLSDWVLNVHEDGG